MKKIVILLSALSIGGILYCLYHSVGHVAEAEFSLPRLVDVDVESAMEVEKDVLANLIVELNETVKSEIIKREQATSSMFMYSVIISVITLLCIVVSLFLAFKSGINKAGIFKKET